jgi:3-methyladenine DNA glycosylase AlkC
VGNEEGDENLFNPKVVASILNETSMTHVSLHQSYFSANSKALLAALDPKKKILKVQN